MLPGHRIIEPIVVSPLLKSGQYDDFGVAIFHWLVQELNSKLEDKLVGYIIEVTKAGRFGEYPALGLRCPDINLDLEKLIEETCDSLLRERPISELIQFIASSGIDWKEVTTKLMTKERKE